MMDTTYFTRDGDVLCETQGHRRWDCSHWDKQDWEEFWDRDFGGQCSYIEGLGGINDGLPEIIYDPWDGAL